MIVRVNKNKNFTVMSNVHLRDRRLSLKAKGLLSVVLALPDDWNYSITGLASISREKEGAINSALKELKDCGYLIINKWMPNETKTGRIEYEWDFYEEPKQDHKKQGLEKQGLEIQGLEVQGLEKQALYKNTNKENTKKENTEGKNNFLPPTVEEVYQYCEERHNNINAQLFVDYYTAKNWHAGKDQIHDWKALVRAWENNQKSNDWQ